MSTGLIVVIIAIGLLLAGGYYVMTSQNADDAMMKGEDAMMKDDTMQKDGDTMMKDESDAMMEEDGAMMDESGDTMMKDGSDAMMDSGAMGESTPIAFTGIMLAGSKSAPLLDFNEKDYQAALASDKLIVLYFYASWCPICKAEFPHAMEAFDSLNRNDVVGFRVHFNDNETTDAQVQLAREFGVAYQHTKVFVRNGERVLKSPEGWETSRYVAEITNALK